MGSFSPESPISILSSSLSKSSTLLSVRWFSSSSLLPSSESIWSSSWHSSVTLTSTSLDASAAFFFLDHLRRIRNFTECSTSSIFWAFFSLTVLFFSPLFWEASLLFPCPSSCSTPSFYQEDAFPHHHESAPMDQAPYGRKLGAKLTRNIIYYY